MSKMSFWGKCKRIFLKSIFEIYASNFQFWNLTGDPYLISGRNFFWDMKILETAFNLLHTLMRLYMKIPPEEFFTFSVYHIIFLFYTCGMSPFFIFFSFLDSDKGIWFFYYSVKFKYLSRERICILFWNKHRVSELLWRYILNIK